MSYASKRILQKNIFLPYKGIRKSRTKFLVKNLKDRTHENITWEKCKEEIRFLNDFYDYHSKITEKEAT